MSLLSLDMKGQTCSFRTISPKDTMTYEGVIIGVAVDSDIANNFTDLVSYNASCRTIDTTISSDISQLNYFIISVTNASGDVERIAFAEEWVQPGSFNLLTQQVKRTFTIYSAPATSSQDIINVNRAAGFTIVETTDA